MHSPEEIAVNFLDLLSRQSLEDAFALLDENVDIVGPDGAGLTKPAFQAMLSGFSGLLAGPFSQEIVGVTAAGPRVAVEMRSHAPLKNGRVYANRYHFLFVVEGGLIKAMREYCDTRAIDAAFAP